MRLVLVSFSFFLPSFLSSFFIYFILFYFILFLFLLLFLFIYLLFYFILFYFIYFFFFLGGGGLTQNLAWSAASIPCMPLQLQQAIRQVRQVRVFVLV